MRSIYIPGVATFLSQFCYIYHRSHIKNRGKDDAALLEVSNNLTAMSLDAAIDVEEAEYTGDKQF